MSFPENSRTDQTSEQVKVDSRDKNLKLDFFPLLCGAGGKKRGESYSKKSKPILIFSH